MVDRDLVVLFDDAAAGGHRRDNDLVIFLGPFDLALGPCLKIVVFHDKPRYVLAILVTDLGLLSVDPEFPSHHCPEGSGGGPMRAAQPDRDFFSDIVKCDPFQDVPLFRIVTVGYILIG